MSNAVALKTKTNKQPNTESGKLRKLATTSLQMKWRN